MRSPIRPCSVVQAWPGVLITASARSICRFRVGLHGNIRSDLGHSESDAVAGSKVVGRASARVNEYSSGSGLSSGADAQRPLKLESSEIGSEADLVKTRNGAVIVPIGGVVSR